MPDEGHGAKSYYIYILRRARADSVPDLIVCGLMLDLFFLHTH